MPEPDRALHTGSHPSARVSRAAQELGRCKRGVRERPSERKRAASIVSVAIARLVRYGRHAEAEAMRMIAYPERMERERIAREAGLK